MAGCPVTCSWIRIRTKISTVRGVCGTGAHWPCSRLAARVRQPAIRRRERRGLGRRFDDVGGDGSRSRQHHRMSAHQAAARGCQDLGEGIIEGGCCTERPSGKGGRDSGACRLCPPQEAANNQVTTSKQRSFCDLLPKSHRTTPEEVVFFASG